MTPCIHNHIAEMLVQIGQQLLRQSSHCKQVCSSTRRRPGRPPMPKEERKLDALLYDTARSFPSAAEQATAFNMSRAERNRRYDRERQRRRRRAESDELRRQQAMATVVLRADAVASPEREHPRRPCASRQKWLLKACRYLDDNPSLNDSEIARLVGVNPSTLSRSVEWQQVRLTTRVTPRAGQQQQPAPKTTVQEPEPAAQQAAEQRGLRSDAMDRLLRKHEVAKVLGVCLRTVTKLTATGQLPAPIRLGRAVRWRASDVQAFIEAGSTQ